jgi:eukaryotic-like serine/threonine-protein kinase
VIARFEAERQALARMEHPHIARVLDAGATDSGRPYFVMELVDGEPITRYCERHKLTIAKRLQLFEQVCSAVQHAHTKGIIHRDLKPSNILVSSQEDAAFAKIIDFGIAKATSGRLTDQSVFTAQFQMIGTPLYMSPEQAEGSADLDTRTDIYSLGVVLYELLTGTTPFTAAALGAADYGEIQRIIRYVDPPTPSVRLNIARPSRVSLNALCVASWTGSS